MLMMLRRGARGWASLCGAFVAVLLGVAVVSLSAVLYAAGAPTMPDRFAAASIVVGSPAVQTPGDPFPESRPWSSAYAVALAGELEGIAGVDTVVVDRTFYAQVVRQERVVTTSTEGHGWSSTLLGRISLTGGTAPTRPGEVVVDGELGLSVGEAVTILTATGPAPYLVAGTVTVHNGSSPGIYLADEEAARLAPGVRVIGLLGHADAQEIERVVNDRGRVLTGDSRAELEPRADARTRWIGSQVLAGMAALAGFVSIFIVAATFAFSVNLRRRELGLLRLVGALPGQIRRLLYAEALAIGTGAAAFGVLVGVVAAPSVGRVLVSAGFEPASYQVQLRWWPVAAAFAVGPVVAVLGVWSASRHATRIRAMEALRDSTVDAAPMTRLRWLVGVLCGIAGVAALIATAAATDTRDMATFSLLATMALIVAATVLAPAVVPLAVRALMLPFAHGPLSHGRGATAMLVRQSALTSVRRTASTAAPVLLTVTFAVLITGNVQTTTGAYAAARGAAIQAGAVLAPDGTPGLSDAALVRGAALLESSVYTGDTVIAALGVDPVAFAEANTRIGDELAGLTGDAMVVARSTATAQGWQPGAAVTLTLPDGERVPVRVIAIVADGAVPAGAVLDRATVRAHDPSALTSAVLLPSRANPTTVVGARTIDVATYAAEADAAEDHLVWVFTLLLVGVSAGYGAVAVANTLLMASAGRRRDFRVLRLAGATPWQVRLAVAAESALVVAIGCLLGGTVAAIALWGGVAALREQAGAWVDVVVPWPTIGLVVATCLLAAVTASILPTRDAVA